MKTTAVPISWVVDEGHRFDCGPFTRGGIEAKKTLQSLRTTKTRLVELTRGGMAGMYHVGMDKLRWVDGPEHGVPFLRSADILRADLTSQPYIARSQVQGNSLFTCPAGSTLITRSGTIGRMAYCRTDMASMAISQDVLKVVPDTDRIASGYLYAFLSSRYGVPLVVSGTFGSIIVHIEAENIAELPVPRFGDLEKRVHHLVVSAANLRIESSKILERAKVDASMVWGIDPDHKLRVRKHPDVRVLQASKLAGTSRFDAFFHGSAAHASDALLAEISRRHPLRRIGDRELTREVFETTRFGRISVEDPTFGVPFLSIADMMRGDPKAESFISRKQALEVRAIVRAGWLILPRVGQLQGVFGTVSYVARHLDSVAVSDNNIRIVPLGEDEGAYLWAALSTDLLYQQVVRRACGTSIPYIDSKRVAEMLVPWPAERHRSRIAEQVKRAMEMRSRASQDEGDAIRLVEQAIHGGGN